MAGLRWERAEEFYARTLVCPLRMRRTTLFFEWLGEPLHCVQAPWQPKVLSTQHVSNLWNSLPQGLSRTTHDGCFSCFPSDCANGFSVPEECVSCCQGYHSLPGLRFSLPPVLCLAAGTLTDSQPLASLVRPPDTRSGSEAFPDKVPTSWPAVCRWHEEQVGPQKALQRLFLCAQAGPTVYIL